MDHDFKEKFISLKDRLAEIHDISHANAVLGWDQATYMPSGGAVARGRQMATLGKLAHEKFTDPALAKLLEDLSHRAEDLDPDGDEARLIQVVQKDLAKAQKIPADFLGRLNVHFAKSYQAWAEARPKNDFASLQDDLECTLDFSRAYANYLGYQDHIADPLIGASDEGMSVREVRPLFAELRKVLVPLVRAVGEAEPLDDSCLKQFYDKDRQLGVGLELAQTFGYDLNRGRQDLTHHPFCTTFSISDVRITTRVNEHDLGDAIFSTLHEAGHALYEQGIHPNLEATPLASGTSSGVHESQSRLWENIIGRSLGFWSYAYPKLQKEFPDQLSKVSLPSFYQAINKVSPSLIRTDADELTYNLHVIIRFDLECQLLEGSLSIADLPEAWHTRYQQDLGLRAQDDRNGVLQDVHWYAGFIGGAFQGYTLGNIMSAQIYQAALKAKPNIPQDIRQGHFEDLHLWLKSHIYQHGRKFSPNELLKRATGETLSISPYLDYLREKYADLYQISL
ncbi:MAG: carboxypeptidase M32 [Deinococcales bacterium]